ncbi:retrovirus-related Pol polyprotein from transposon RE1 [Trichonephila clavipes]|nr:retrovirus-related Pol polyprotein from transposon RE1 [Trichonephila clavipes]
MNSVASTLNRVTGMEFNNKISVLTPNNWNTWKHDMQVLLMHYGYWQFIIQTKPEQPDEEATYKEILDLQLRKDRCYTLIYTNISSDLKNLITETTDGVAAWKILKDHFEPVTKARVIQLLDQFFGTKYQPGEDVGIFISRVKTAATRLQEAGHKLDDLYIGFQLIRWLPQEFQSTVQQIYRWKEEDFRVVKIEAELILEANRLQLMKQDMEKAENAYLSSFTSKKSKTLPGATAAAHGDPNGKNDYQKKGGKVFNCKTIKNVKQSIKTIGPCYVCNKYGHLKVNCKEKKSLQKSPSTVNETFNTEFDKGVWVIDTAATNHFCNDKSLFLDLKPITNMKMSLATEDKSCPVEGIGTLRFRVKYKGSFHEITLTDVLFNPKLRRNLLSGSRLESKGAHFVGTKDGIKTLLKSSEVPHKFWGEALLCFTYAWNRICHKDSNKTPFEKYSGGKPSVLHLKPFGCLAYAGVPKQIRKKFDMRAKMGIMMGYAQHTKGYRIWLIDENKLVETINVRFDENKRGINFKQKVNSNLGYNLKLPDYYDDEDDFDRVKYSLTSRLVSKKSTETPSTSENPDVSSDNQFDPIKDDTESQGFSDLSEQQEALMVEVTIPNCYKQAIRSRDASKWHDAMDKEINVMKERKVWDLVDHPDNIKILENPSESDEQQALRLENLRVHATETRSSESSDQREVRLETDRIRTNQIRSSERTELRERRLQNVRISTTRSRRTLHADLNLSAFHYDSNNDYSLPPNVVIGKMDKICMYCSALKFKNETRGMCCASGKVKLPELHSPPEPLSTFLSGVTRVSKHFLENIRKYNSCFQMTSFGATNIVRENYMPIFRVQGQIYHHAGSLLPLPDANHKFLQIYFMANSDEQIEQRCHYNAGTRREIVGALQGLFYQHNELVRLFKTAIQRMPADDYAVVIRADKRPVGQHERQFNAPTIDEVAIVIVSEELESRDIILHRRSGDIQRVSETHRSYDGLQYPILFICNEKHTMILMNWGHSLGQIFRS